jgi:Holliday junction DNA helicase RuvA
VIAFLRGRVAARTGAYCVLDVGGVGYRVAMPTGALVALPPVGEVVTVLTHLQVREDDMSLFGFLAEEERELFELLITVSGIGPKVALAVLSAIPPVMLAQAVAAEDVPLISTIPGIGKKTAQRIIVELKDRLEVEGLAPVKAGRALPAQTEARDALVGMGFASAEAATAVSGYEAADGDEPVVEDIVRFALKRLGGGR